MISSCTRRFWQTYEALPAHVQKQADKAYDLWRKNKYHPSLHFEKLRANAGILFSVRVGAHYRALGQETAGGITWVWIGTHEDYNNLI